MKTVKNDNKGFSLVELIVVVLIMGILAVALAPQVMKWVENSRITSDENAAGNIKSAVQVAIADYQSKGGNMGTTGTLTYKINGVFNAAATGTVDTTNDDDHNATTTEGKKQLSYFIDKNLGGESYATKWNSTGFTITVDISTGKVTVAGGGVGQSLK